MVLPQACPSSIYQQELWTHWVDLPLGGEFLWEVLTNSEVILKENVQAPNCCLQLVIFKFIFLHLSLFCWVFPIMLNYLHWEHGVW